MFEARDIPYRCWRQLPHSDKFRVVQTAQSRKLLTAMGRALKRGAAVELVHCVAHIDPPNVYLGKRRKNVDYESRQLPHHIHDTISLKITD